MEPTEHYSTEHKQNSWRYLVNQSRIFVVTTTIGHLWIKIRNWKGGRGDLSVMAIALASLSSSAPPFLVSIRPPVTPPEQTHLNDIWLNETQYITLYSKNSHLSKFFPQIHSQGLNLETKLPIQASKFLF